jgi:hypothetical protein
MTAVFDYSEARGSDRLVLLVIADRSDDDGTGCFRGKESIARMARVSRATVTAAIRRLQEIGELEVEQRPGRTSRYRVTVGRDPARFWPPSDEGGSATRLADTRPGSSPHPATRVAAIHPPIHPLTIPTANTSCSRDDARVDAREEPAENENAARSRARKRTARDDLWDALADGFGVPRTTAERTGFGKVVSGLVAAGATPEQVATAIGELRRRDWTNPTVHALENHWTELLTAAERRGESDGRSRFDRWSER